jgi:hypothetical protein
LEVFEGLPKKLLGVCHCHLLARSPFSIA